MILNYLAYLSGMSVPVLGSFDGSSEFQREVDLLGFAASVGRGRLKRL
jgi:hypothetical protein